MSEVVGLYVYPADVRSSEEWMQLSAARYCSTHKIACNDFTVSRTERGKPYFANTPQLYVSVTHSGSYCIVAISPCQVGIDLQTHNRFKNETAENATARYRKLSKRFFHPAEDAYVQPAPATRFFTVWTAKESYVKYTGTGLDDSLWTYSLLPEDTAQLQCWQAQNVYFQSIAFQTGYSLCLCTERPVDYQLYTV